MTDDLALDLALDGRINPASPEVAHLVGVADRVAEMPDPSIDPRFAARLEAVLMAEMDQLAASTAPATPARPLAVVRTQPKAVPTPAAPTKTAPTPVIPLPRRRMVLRKSLVAAAAALMAMAFPVMAMMGAVPGSPLWPARAYLMSQCGSSDACFARTDQAIVVAAQAVAIGNPEGALQAVALAEEVQGKGVRFALDTADRVVITWARTIVKSQNIRLAELANRLPAAVRPKALETVAAGEALSDDLTRALGQEIRSTFGPVAPIVKGTVRQAGTPSNSGGGSTSQGTWSEDNWANSGGGSDDRDGDNRGGTTTPNPTQPNPNEGTTYSGRAPCIGKVVRPVAGICPVIEALPLG